MRLKESEVQAIKSVIWAMDPEAKIFLFGSRADDTKRGGDLDLLILSTKLNDRNKQTIRLGLYDQLGEQKIDLVIAQDQSKPFVRLALAEGVEL
jgi:predicted nucleotidyltransferase